MESMDTIETLFEEQLRDLYSAENQLLKALPKMARKASSSSLQDAFENHLDETRIQLERLQQIGENCGIKLGGHKCKAMEGLIEEGSEVLDYEGDDSVIDAALIAAAQRIEHYEISAYGTARTLAEKCNDTEAVDLLQQTLDEESAADEKLTQISEGEILPNAPVGMEEGDEGEEDEESSGFMAEAGSARGSRSMSRGRTASKSATRNTSSRSGSSSGSRSSRSGASSGSRSRGGSSSSRSGGSSRGGSRASKSRSSR